ncbi:MAG: cell division protein FtsZ [Schwartzia sp.]|nr:cell division protein FtsZ [Schwartzia sp. (in: firmicutes)]
METLAAGITKAIIRIKVVGVGGGGNSVLLRLAEDRIPGIELIAVNTDAGQLSTLKEAGIEILQIGERLTRGRGTGSVPELGMKAAESDAARLEMALRDADLVFITAGMGGGVGTGAAPVIAKLARKLGMLSIGVVTVPFSFEGKRKLRIAEDGVEALREQMDALLVVHNDNLMKLPENKRMTLVQSFKVADGILRQAILCISEVILTTGVVNVDFADVVSIFRQSNSSDALLGIGESQKGSVVEAVQHAIESPLVERDLKGARGLIMNISGDERLPLFEVSEAMEYVAGHTHPDVNIVFGTVVEPALGSTVRATLVATDFVDSADVYRTPRLRTDQPGMARRAQMARRPMAPPPTQVQTMPQPQPAQAAPPQDTPQQPSREAPRAMGLDITLPEFVQNRRAEIPPLILRTDDGGMVPPFRPKR